MEETTRRLATRYSGITAVAAILGQPIPGLDEFIVVPLHYRLVRRIANERNVPVRSLPWKQLRRIIWYGALGRAAGNYTVGLVPGLGSATNAATAIALTEYLARYLDDVIANPEREAPEVTRESLKALFTDALDKVRRKKDAEAQTEAPATAESGGTT
jgi:uncharacterized protein (DUF697 family)